MLTAGKLASLEDFQMQKDELLGQMDYLKEQLEQQKQEHQTVIYHLEKKAVLDNYRLVYKYAVFLSLNAKKSSVQASTINFQLYYTASSSHFIAVGF